MSKWTEFCDDIGIELQSSYNGYGSGGLQYPTFTAEKQLAVMEFLSEYDFNSYSYRLTEEGELKWTITLEADWPVGHGDSFSDALIDLVTKIYPRLLESRQKALKEILEK